MLMVYLSTVLINLLMYLVLASLKYLGDNFLWCTEIKCKVRVRGHGEGGHGERTW
jgi:hypothetical protein